ncbi:hypothetical protein [Erythrobacter sp. SG61-1L]|uniref:hypothetical protein n=1 Tax=Erythrobacter sp. SG61-1L TaxID=1603897 RepID=UPI000A7FF3EA|nr:hypothetical protein [Erythrobacter sp. SG61-1L]
MSGLAAFGISWVESGHLTRHPELVSGSISPDRTAVREDTWLLKQVQHDDSADVRNIVVSGEAAFGAD